MKSYIFALAASAYLVGAVFTFGLVFNRIECAADRSYFCTADVKAAQSLLAAAFWPFTLSAIAQEREAGRG